MRGGGGVGLAERGEGCGGEGSEGGGVVWGWAEGVQPCTDSLARVQTSATIRKEGNTVGPQRQNTNQSCDHVLVTPDVRQL